MIEREARPLNKKLLTLFLAICMICTLLPFSAFADTATSGKCGENTTWSYKDGVLTISGTGEINMWDANIPSDIPWYKYHENINTIIINNGITRIYDWSFYDCNSVTSISIPSSVEAIGYCAFASCDKLTNISVSKDNKNYCSIDGIVYTKNATELTACPAGKSGSVSIKDGVESINDGAFRDCSKLTSVSIPNSVKSIGFVAFWGCSKLTSVSIPPSVEHIYCGAFSEMSGLGYIFVSSGNKNYDSFNGILYSKDFTELIACPGQKAGRVVIRDGVKSIERYAFSGCRNITSIDIPKSVEIIDYLDSSHCDKLTDIYYHGTKSQWTDLMEYVTDSTDGHFFNAVVHYNCNQSSVYNLGEETYSFENYSSFLTAGHCFGMAITSSGYYLGVLDSSKVGASNGNIYKLKRSSKVEDPINYCQKRQGSYAVNSIVAGGTYWKLSNINQKINPKYNIAADWKSVVNYVKNHEYDDKGMLELGLQIDGVSCHSVNFLRYSKVDGQDRIYAYDNEWPTGELYFYKGSDGKVYMEPTILYGNTPIDSIELSNVKKYLNLVEASNSKALSRYLTHAIYAEKGTISVEGATDYPFSADTVGTEYIVFEVPENFDKVNITPLVDNATLIYLDKEYSFSKSDGKVGVLELSDSEDNNNATWTISNDNNSKNPFVDVKKGSYYYDSVLWAVGKGITKGVDANHFAPGNDCTRGQIVTFLWRANGCPEVKGQKNPFVDVDKGSYCYEAVLWAVKEGITKGVDATHFKPGESCTRGQVVTFLWRADGQPSYANTKCPFKDVSKGAFYYDAMMWAVENGITKGTDASHFAPNQICNRGQIVTFLYRDMK